LKDQAQFTAWNKIGKSSAIVSVGSVFLSKQMSGLCAKKQDVGGEVAE
jgi:hypothetical protein